MTFNKLQTPALKYWVFPISTTYPNPSKLVSIPEPKLELKAPPPLPLFTSTTSRLSLQT